MHEGLSFAKSNHVSGLNNIVPLYNLVSSIAILSIMHLSTAPLPGHSGNVTGTGGDAHIFVSQLYRGDVIPVYTGMFTVILGPGL